MTSPLLSMQSITKDFPGVRALDDVNFQVCSGEIHALCGENGAGKSTLIKILGGVHPHGTYEGELHINGKTQRFRNVRDAEHSGIAVIHQELALIPEMSVAENIYLGREPQKYGVIDKPRLYKEAGELLAQFGLEIPLQGQVYKLGIGQQQLVEIAKALSRNARLLVLDEPTAALTQTEVEILYQILGQLREKGVACVYITHKLKEVFQIADRVTVLRDGKTVGTQSIEECTEDKLISQMVGRELTSLFPVREAPLSSSKNNEVALRVENISTYPHEPPSLKNISFEVHRGEILGIAGLMGAGRTELINTIFGANTGKWDGNIYKNGIHVKIHTPRDAIQQGMALVSEDRKRYGLILDDDVVQNMTLANLTSAGEITSLGIINRSVSYRKSKEYVESLRIKTASYDLPVRQLSGGNQQKVVLGKWLMTRPKVLFLDEPTRGIDVGAKTEIHSLTAQLANEGVAIVLVSSELPEILGMSDRVLVLHEGRITGEFNNDNLTQEDIMRCATGT
ncbi:ATP-binding cassette domain-containing protein [Candidatus Poribacteria bacterium]|nr:ATP-binding cassette domain-containing protein [Candidatus Poribacteria bacterium]